jgi:conjugal transfer/entry exclusion protein
VPVNTFRHIYSFDLADLENIAPPEPLYTGTKYLSSHAIAGDKLAAVMVDPTSPGELFVADLASVDSSAAAVTNLNERQRTNANLKYEVVEYKTRSGYVAPPPAITLIRLSDNAQVYSNNMAEIFGGIYEHTFLADALWGAGSYRVTCTDPNAADSMVVELIGGGTLAGVPGMITSLSNQLFNLEIEVTNISSIVSTFDLSGISNALGNVTNDLSQLTNVLSTVSSMTNTLGNITNDLTQLSTIVSTMSTITNSLGSINWSDITNIRDNVDATLTNLTALSGSLGAVNWADITNIRDNVDTVLTNLSVLSGVNWSQVAQLTNAVTAIDDLTAAMGGLDWNDVTALDTKVNTIQGYTEQIQTILTEVQGLGGIDYTMVERIEKYLGKEGDSASTGTLFGQINSLKGQMNTVGSGVSDAASKAQQAKSQAATAASGVTALKKSIGEGDLERSLAILEDVRRSMLLARKDLDQIPRVVKFASLHDDMMYMARKIEELAESQTWQDWLEGAGLQGVEADGTAKSLGNLNNNIEIMKAEMKLLQKVIDRTSKQPQVEAVLIGVPD